MVIKTYRFSLCECDMKWKQNASNQIDKFLVIINWEYHILSLSRWILRETLELYQILRGVGNWFAGKFTEIYQLVEMFHSTSSFHSNLWPRQNDHSLNIYVTGNLTIVVWLFSLENLRYFSINQSFQFNEKRNSQQVSDKSSW